MADIKTAEERSKNMAAIKSKNTSPELFIRKELFRRGYRYRLYEKSVPGHPDLFLRKYNTAIFIHGCFWHRHPGCKYAYVPKTNTDFWNQKFDANIRRDKFVKDALAEDGIRCLVIWECKIKDSEKHEEQAQQLFDSIEQFLNGDSDYLEI